MALLFRDNIEGILKRPVTVIVGFIIAYLVFNVLYQLFLHPLRKVPGPFAARFTRLWELNATTKGNWVEINRDLHERFGPVVRIAPDRYSLANQESFKTIYGHGSKFIKSDFYNAFGHPDPERANLFSETNSQSHSAKRRMVASLYSMTALLSYEQFVDHCNDELCDKLRSFAAEGRAIDVPDWMQYYAFDVIGEISVGKSFGYMQTESDPRGILSAIDESMVYGSRIGLLPELHPRLAFIGKTLGMKIPFDRVGVFIQENVDARTSGKQESTRQDFLTKLLVLEDGGKVDRANLYTTVGANIAAGSDTTAVSLSAIIYYLIKNPQTMKQLQEEIDQSVAKGEMSNPVRFAEAQKMPYLQAVIMEALRLHPATGQIMPRVVPAEGASIAGYFFPKGAVVGMNPWVYHLDPTIFGDEPSQFRPERWLEDPAQAATMEANLFSFGAGSRTCIGRNISTLEMVKVIPQIVRQFDLELVDPASGWDLNCHWFVKQKYECRFKLRGDTPTTR